MRIGYGASVAAMLQTVAVMGPARINAPLTQALTAPMLGALHRRGTSVPLQFVACFAIRLAHYVVLTAALVWIILGGVDAYVGSYDTLTGWLGILPEGKRGALIVTVFINVVLAIFYSVTQVLVYRWALDVVARERRAGRARRWPTRARTAARCASTRARSRSPPRSRSRCC